jgi:hypothetical protein
VAALDGGYVRNWDGRKSNFELIASRSGCFNGQLRFRGNWPFSMELKMCALTLILQHVGRYFDPTTRQSWFDAFQTPGCPNSRLMVKWIDPDSQPIELGQRDTRQVRSARKSISWSALRRRDIAIFIAP